MRLIEDIPRLAGVPGPLSLAIGVFDGVHAGHQAVIRHAVAQAAESGGEAVVVSFRPHPQRILRPEVAPRLLTSTPHKVRILSRLGIENLLLVPFTRAFSRLGGDEFIRRLVDSARGIHSVSVGRSWEFGHQRSGNLDLLRRMGEAAGFRVTGVGEVLHDGEPVSSTRIRRAVGSGDLAAAEAMLRRRLSLFGVVVEGRHEGRDLGFPTANVRVQNEQLPPNGVYAAHALLHTERMPAVVNLGIRPTLDPGRSDPVLEAHILDFNANLYGTELEIEIIRRLRDEQRFESADALRRQIAQDVALARQLAANAE